MDSVRQQPENDETEQTPANATDQAIAQAVGEELRRARRSVGWTRPELVRRMKTPIPVNTYACYEQGIRPCPIARLVDVCQTLDINVGALLSLALQRLELNLEQTGVQIDLQKILRDEREELSLLRKWASNRMQTDKSIARSDGPAVVRLEWAVVNEVAIFCGLSRRKMLNYIRDFTPDSAPRP